ncbi:hypothetical protein [Anaeromicropila populeti]|uniref:SH3 domain-containing protein n=1 Tax=Anaeromicropila populeti TaxID=37658 RepID=A0A1I6JYH1_9FIRM|nr:hypothetical protein [Anaeromicropila populeti]SFR84035.1 hypothetical protein SAMN05661086_02088 [Anaeromicropila populeti]
MRKITYILFLILISCCLFGCSPQKNAETTPTSSTPSATPESKGSDFRQRALQGEIVEIPSGSSVDLDGDSKDETIELLVPADDEESYSLTVGDYTLDNSCYGLTGKIFLANLYGKDLFVLIGEYGPSNDDATYIYSYIGHVLTYLGVCAGLPDVFEINSDNTFSTTVRGNTLQTWFHRATYVITMFQTSDTRDFEYIGFSEVPKGMYPVGTMVSANIEIPVSKSRYDQSIAFDIQPGEIVMFSASDDSDWIYVTTLVDRKSGYIRIGSDTNNLVVDGTEVSGGDCFNGLCYAD